MSCKLIQLITDIHDEFKKLRVYIDYHHSVFLFLQEETHDAVTFVIWKTFELLDHIKDAVEDF